MKEKKEKAKKEKEKKEKETSEKGEEVNRKLTRVTSACTNCKRKKTRCETERPCSHCIRHDWECVSKEPSKRGPRKYQTRREDRTSPFSSSSSSSSSYSSLFFQEETFNNYENMLFPISIDNEPDGCDPYLYVEKDLIEPDADDCETESCTDELFSKFINYDEEPTEILTPVINE